MYIGWPGRVHDARVLRNSKLYHKGQSRQLLPNRTKFINGVEVPLVILGDPTYLLLTWLMKPYPEYIGMPRKHRTYNYQLSKDRIVVEHAFGRLKGRWRCLLKRLDYHLGNVPNVVATCVVLHNICESMGDEFHKEWAHNTSEPEEVGGNASSVAGNTVDTAAGAIRDVFADYFA